MPGPEDGIDLSQEMLTSPKSPEITSMAEAVRVLSTQNGHRDEESFDEVKKRQPLMHYSKAGNVLQILRFGLQSNNFKDRLNETRSTDPEADRIAQQMCGIRIKQGGSYQGKDSISLSQYNDQMFAGPGNLLLLINPGIKTFGTDEPREATGYGHGIRNRTEDGFEIGNPTAYSDEVLAANIILPQEIQSVVVASNESMLRDMSMVTLENTKLYLQEKMRNSNAAEDLVANIKLLADFNQNPSLMEAAENLQKKAGTLRYQELAMAVNTLQRQGLQEFVGLENPLDEANFRSAIEKKFGIKIFTNQNHQSAQTS